MAVGPAVVALGHVALTVEDFAISWLMVVYKPFRYQNIGFFWCSHVDQERPIELAVLRGLFLPGHPQEFYLVPYSLLHGLYLPCGALSCLSAHACMMFSISTPLSPLPLHMIPTLDSPPSCNGAQPRHIRSERATASQRGPLLVRVKTYGSQTSQS